MDSVYTWNSVADIIALQSYSSFFPSDTVLPLYFSHVYEFHMKVLDKEPL